MNLVAPRRQPVFDGRVLFERETLLSALRACLSEAGAGHGRLVALSGEAGIGKSSLIRQFIEDSSGVRVLIGVCDGVLPARPMGPLDDVADALGRQFEGWHHGYPDRLDLFRGFRSVLGDRLTLLVIEDVHWADQATLDFLRYLGRRLEQLPLLVVLTYRSDAVGANHPLTSVLGDLSSSATTTRLEVPALSATAVAQWVRAARSPINAAALSDRTSGNPFFIGEVLDAGLDAIPVGVRDMLLARASRLTPAGRAILDSAAICGNGAPSALVIEAAAVPAGGLDECLDGGLLVRDGDRLAFRHDLARETFERAVPAATGSVLAARALTWLQRNGSTDDRLLAALAERAGNAAAVLAHAPRAARRAGELGAHVEAVHHLRAAVRHRRALPDEEQADLLDALSYECYLTDRQLAAIESRQLAVDLRLHAGDTRKLGTSLRWMSRISWMLGRTVEAHEWGERAVRALEALPAGRELAMAYSNMSQLSMLAGDADSAAGWGNRAIALATELGADDVLMHAQNNVGTAIGCAGRLAEGRALLEASLDLALRRDEQEHVARAFTNLASIGVSNQSLDAARVHLDAGIAYCTERDLDVWVLSLESEAAVADLASGDWDSSLQRCDRILDNRHGSAVIRVTALWVSGLIGMRRGSPDAAAHLDEAHALATRMEDPQNRVPVTCARAEAAWTLDRLSTVRAEIDRVRSRVATCDHGWWIGELAWWSMLSGHRDRPLHSASQPFDLMLGGQWRAAADAWERHGNPFWRAICLTRSDDPADRRVAHALLTALGATATLQAAQREWLRRGVPVPRGPRPVNGDAQGLTARELEVLELLGEGLRNAEIADRLVLSEKTVAHHVSAVLRKLAVPTRARATTRARQLGILTTSADPASWAARPM